MRSILNKHPSVKISGLKYSIAVPSNTLDNLLSNNALNDILNKQVKPVSKYSLALIINLT
jgi:hypothetical protein